MSQADARGIQAAGDLIVSDLKKPSNSARGLFAVETVHQFD